MQHYYITSPLEQFEIQELWYQNLLGYNATLTNIGLYFIIIFGLIISMNYFSDNLNYIIPSRWSFSQESIYSVFHNMVLSQIGGTKGQLYFPLIYSLFILILISNFLGNIPYSFAVTSHLVFTIGLSITILIGVTILGFMTHKLKFFALFVPAGTPLSLVPLLVIIEFISYLARAISLGLRLGANVMAGHMLLTILSGFLYNIMTSSFLLFILALLPFALVIGIAGLELAISAIQSYVFAILTSSYIKDALDLH